MIQVGDARDFIPVFKEAQKKGLKLALHLAEVCTKLSSYYNPTLFDDIYLFYHI